MKTLFLNSIIALLFLGFGSCQENTQVVKAGPGRQSLLEGKIISVKDGDTFNILIGETQKAIRLAHVDCPEKGQPFGAKAKQLAAELCFGKSVTVKTDGSVDRNKRVIGEVYLADGTNVNKELVKQGFAWHYKKYSKSAEYAELENLARIQRLGLWSDDEPKAPWEWRRKR